MAEDLIEETGRQDDPEARLVLEAVKTTAYHHSGPIPPAYTLEEYEAVVPGAAREIMDAWHEQRRHRLAMERENERADRARQNRGQFLAFGIAALGLVCAAAVGIFGDLWLATIIGIVAIGGPTAATYLARSVRPPPPATTPGDDPARSSPDANR